MSEKFEISYRDIGVGAWWSAVIDRQRADGTIDITIPRTGTTLTRIGVFVGPRPDCPKGCAHQLNR